MNVMEGGGNGKKYYFSATAKSKPMPSESPINVSENEGRGIGYYTNPSPKYEALDDVYSEVYANAIEKAKQEIIGRDINDPTNDFNGGYSRNKRYFSPNNLSNSERLYQKLATLSPTGNYTDNQGRMWYSERKMPWQSVDRGSEGIENRSNIFRFLDYFD